MNDDLSRRSIQAVLWSYVGGVGKVLAQLLVQIWLARLLGPAVFGQYSAVLVVIGFGWLFADSGFGAALIQKKTITDEDVGYALGWILLLSFICGGLIVLTAPLIAEAMGELNLVAPLRACGPIVLLQAVSNLSASLMRRDLDMKRNQAIQLAAYIVGFGLTAIVLATLGAGVWSLVIGFLVQTLIVLVASFALVRHTLRPRLRGDANLRQFGLKVLGTNLANWSVENLDRFIIGRQWGLATLGAYSAASNLSRVPVSLLATSFQSVLFSSASRVQDDLDRLRRGYLATVSLATIVTFPLSALLALKADFIVHLLYGDRWSEAGTLFSAFCVALPFYVLLSLTGPVLWALGAVARELRVQLLCAAALMAGLFLLSAQPIAHAVWLIPAIYGARFALVYLQLCQCVPIKHVLTLKALSGGCLLASLVVVVELSTNFLIPNMQFNQQWWEVGQSILEGLLCFLTLRAFPGFIVGQELRKLLLSRISDSKVVRTFCTLIALRESKA
jgi:lipopolysaccharide exporter